MTTHHLGERDASLDIARGLAIIMIVLGHVLRGLVGAGIIDADAEWREVTDRVLYSVHLGVFAFAAGLFIGRGVERSGVLRYLRQRDLTFLWLYLLWSLIQGAVKVAAGSSVNSASSLADVFDLVHPEGQLWFLPWLIVVTTVAAATRIWRSPPIALVGVAVALLVSVLGWRTDPGIAGAQGLGLWVFFAVGVAWQSGPVLTLLRCLTAVQAAVIAAVALAAYSALVVPGIAASPTPSAGPSPTALSVATGLLATSVGVVGVVALSRLLAVFRQRWLGAVGRRTLEIFLGSIIFASGGRIVLAHLGVDSAVVHIVAGTVLGVVGPMVLAALVVRLRLRWLFAAPRAITGAV